jgi:O-antigen ligase
MYFFSSEDVKDKLPKVFAISVSISALLSIVGYLFNISILSLETYSLKRATGAEQDPNFLASMLIFSLPFISHYIFLARGVLNRGFWMCLFFINMAAIILTYSRSGSLVTAVVFILLIRTYYHYLNLRKLGFAVIGVFVALSVFISSVPSSYWDRVGSVTNIQTDRSLGRRTSYLGVAKEQFFENPLLGSGPGTFRDYYGQSMEAIAFQKEGKTNKRPAHNVYLEVLIGTGAIGLLCYLGLLYFVLRLFKKARLNFLKIHNIELVSLTNAYCTALLGLLCYSLFLSNLYHDYIWLSLAAAQMLFNLSKEYTLVEEKA